MYACLRGQERVVQLLIDKGADPQVMDKVANHLVPQFSVVLMHMILLFSER